MKPLQKRLSAYREMQGLSYEALAKRLGCSNVYLWMLETGKNSNPSLKILKALAKEFDCTLDQLVHGD
jgi:transcriptional regulator with XRE-family HTH domain